MNFDDDDGRQRPIGGNDALDRKIVAASPSPYNRSKKQGGDGQSGNDDEHVTLNDADVLCGRGKCARYGTHRPLAIATSRLRLSFAHAPRVLPPNDQAKRALIMRVSAVRGCPNRCSYRWSLVPRFQQKTLSLSHQETNDFETSSLRTFQNITSQSHA